MLVALPVLAVLYAMLYRESCGFGEGACFGALIAIFLGLRITSCNYVNRNMGLK